MKSIQFSISAKAAKPSMSVGRQMAAGPARAFVGSTKGFSAKALKSASRKTIVTKAASGSNKTADAYSDALAQLAVKDNSLEAVHSDMETLSGLLTDDFLKFLNDPVS